MHKLLITTWVNNVNNLRTAGSKTGAQTCTRAVSYIKSLLAGSLQVGFINQPINKLFAYQSTHLFTHINLLNNSFTHYPQHLLICNPNKI